MQVIVVDYAGNIVCNNLISTMSKISFHFLYMKTPILGEEGMVVLMSHSQWRTLNKCMPFITLLIGVIGRVLILLVSHNKENTNFEYE